MAAHGQHAEEGRIGGCRASRRNADLGRVGRRSGCSRAPAPDPPPRQVTIFAASRPSRGDEALQPVAPLQHAQRRVAHEQRRGPHRRSAAEAIQRRSVAIAMPASPTPANRAPAVPAQRQARVAHPPAPGSRGGALEIGALGLGVLRGIGLVRIGGRHLRSHPASSSNDGSPRMNGKSVGCGSSLRSSTKVAGTLGLVIPVGSCASDFTPGHYRPNIRFGVAGATTGTNMLQ